MGAFKSASWFTSHKWTKYFISVLVSAEPDCSTGIKQYRSVTVEQWNISKEVELCPSYVRKGSPLHNVTEPYVFEWNRGYVDQGTKGNDKNIRLSKNNSRDGIIKLSCNQSHEPKNIFRTILYTEGHHTLWLLLITS